MRKTRLSPIGNSSAAPGHDWLDLEQAARAEVSSEAEGYPVEGALLKDVRGGWRASEPGIQTIRLLFDHPQTIRVIQLVFKEKEFTRTQEFVLRWLPQGTRDWKDVVPAAVELQSTRHRGRMRRIQGRPSLGHRA